MTDAELLKLVVLNIPNFLGFAISVFLMYKQNQQLLELLRECNERSSTETIE